MLKLDFHNAALLFSKMRKWRGEVEPKLMEQEARPTFALGEYTNTVITWLKDRVGGKGGKGGEGGVGGNHPETSHRRDDDTEDKEKATNKHADGEADITEMFAGKPTWEICRLFLTVLLLRNNGNLDFREVEDVKDEKDDKGYMDDSMNEDHSVNEDLQLRSPSSSSSKTRSNLENTGLTQTPRVNESIHNKQNTQGSPQPGALAIPETPFDTSNTLSIYPLPLPLPSAKKKRLMLKMVNIEKAISYELKEDPTTDVKKKKKNK